MVSAVSVSPVERRTPVAVLLSLERMMRSTEAEKRYLTPSLCPIFTSVSGIYEMSANDLVCSLLWSLLFLTFQNPPLGYQIPSASSVYCNKLYVPGASNGLIPMYILPNVNTLLNLSVQKYFDALL